VLQIKIQGFFLSLIFFIYIFTPINYESKLDLTFDAKFSPNKAKEIQNIDNLDISTVQNENVWIPMNYTPKSLDYENGSKDIDLDSIYTVKYDFIENNEIWMESISEFVNLSDVKNRIVEPYKADIEQNDNYVEESIIGQDGRVKISPTTSFPYRTICKLYMIFGTNQYIGSGAIIDKNHVLTAAHNVYQKDEGGWVDSMLIIPAKDGSSEPYGSSTPKTIRVLSEWIINENPNYDFAVITLYDDLGLSTGWMGRMTSDYSDPIYSGPLNIAGYPGDLDNGEYMYASYENGDHATEFKHYYYLDTFGGMSGSPVWIYDGSNRYIISVHAYGGTNMNSGTRIDRVKFDTIEDWLLADSSGNDYPDLISRGESYTGFTPDVVGSGLTDFRVWMDVSNIGTSDCGEYTLSFYASSDTDISSSDYLIDTFTYAGINYGYSSNISSFGRFPNNIPTGTYYIGWIIDVNDDITEFQEDNNIGYIKSKTLLVDADAPHNPTQLFQTRGNIKSGEWQNQVSHPYFYWTGAYDGETSIKKYWYYWGYNPNANYATGYTTSPSLDIYNEYSENYNGIYYLRIQTEDEVGNLADWQTYYVFKYDSELPDNPQSCTIINGDVNDDEWQTKVNTPIFEWESGYDFYSGIKGYYIYFGQDPEGESAYFINKTQYYADEINEEGIYYFRINTVDNAGNEAGWITLFIFKYGDDSLDEEIIMPFSLILIISLIGIGTLISVFVLKKKIIKPLNSKRNMKYMNVIENLENAEIYKENHYSDVNTNEFNDETIDFEDSDNNIGNISDQKENGVDKWEWEKYF